jgi:FixJ family two-component response regulator
VLIRALVAGRLQTGIESQYCCTLPGVETLNKQSQAPLVAVVDDDVSVRRSLLRLLRSAGFNVTVYDSGESFLAQQDLVVPSCLILDVHLTGVSGPDVKQFLTQKGWRVPTIFITAHDEEATLESMRRFPGVACLRKPFPGNSLLDLIRKTLAA